MSCRLPISLAMSTTPCATCQQILSISLLSSETYSRSLISRTLSTWLISLRSANLSPQFCSSDYLQRNLQLLSEFVGQTDFLSIKLWKNYRTDRQSPGPSVLTFCQQVQQPISLRDFSSTTAKMRLEICAL
ncbi:hypothetical protein KP509_22G072000 [Ceratopteris richardii]|uniref:Uncharacterized protein n=1 Tax=Ceratopteris richardii TaxID=49495 RepID=A0A8T2S9N1_CERRI|nr:hypothetical protein KP509_22G072000 [Ceratopteris richardii]